MEFLKQWTICVCTTIIIAVVFSMLAPSGKMSRFYKLLLSVFICVSIIYPFLDFDITSLDFNTRGLMQEIQRNEENSYTDTIKNNIKQILKSHDITGVDIDCNVHINGDEIEIRFLQIAIPSEYSKKDVEKIVFDEMGINAQVIYIGE